MDWTLQLMANLDEDAHKNILLFKQSYVKSIVICRKMDLPVELVQLLQHAGIEGQKLTWDLQVNSTAVSVKLVASQV
jgi:hypothetical protein